MDDLEILFADVSSETTSYDNTLTLNSVPNSKTVTSQSQWCESCNSLAVAIEEKYSRNFLALKQKIFFTDNIIQMYEKCKKQFQEAEKAAQVANENCNSMCAEKNLAQAQLNMMLADQEPVMKENKSLKDEIKVLESKMQTMEIELRAMDESRRLHEETIKVLRNEEKGEVYDRKKKQSQKMAQLKEQLSDKTAANVDLLKTNKLLQRRVDRLEKKLRNATNYGLHLGEEVTEVGTTQGEKRCEEIELTKMNAEVKRKEDSIPPTSKYSQRREDENSSHEMLGMETEKKEMVAYITSTTATDESDDELTVPAKGQTAEDINRQVEKVLPNHRKISNNKKAPNSIKNRMMDLKKKRVLRSFVRRPSEKHLADLIFIVERMQKTFHTFPPSTQKNKSSLKGKLNDELSSFCSKHSLESNEPVVLSKILKLYKNKFKIPHLVWLQSELSLIADGDNTVNFSEESMSEESMVSSQSEIVKHKFSNSVEENKKINTETNPPISPNNHYNSDKNNAADPEMPRLENNSSTKIESSTAKPIIDLPPFSNVLPGLSYSDSIIDVEAECQQNGSDNCNEEESKSAETAFPSVDASSVICELDSSLDESGNISDTPQNDDFISVMPAIDDILPSQDLNITENISTTIAEDNQSSEEKHESIETVKTDETNLHTKDTLTANKRDDVSSGSDVPTQDDWILPKGKTRIARTVAEDSPSVKEDVSSETNHLPNTSDNIDFVSAIPMLGDLSLCKDKISNTDNSVSSNSGQLLQSIIMNASRSLENDKDVVNESSATSELNDITVLESEADVATMSDQQMPSSLPAVLPSSSNKRKRKISGKSIPINEKEICRVTRMRTRSISAESEKSVIISPRRSRRISEREESSSSSSEITNPQPKKRRRQDSSSQLTKNEIKLFKSESRSVSGTSPTKFNSETSECYKKSNDTRAKEREQKSILSPDSTASSAESSAKEKLCLMEADKNVDSSYGEESVSDMEIVEEKSGDIGPETEILKLLRENEKKINQKGVDEANGSENDKLKISIPQVFVTSSGSDIEHFTDSDDELHGITELNSELLPPIDQNDHEDNSINVESILLEFSTTFQCLSPMKSTQHESKEAAEPSILEDVSGKSLHIDSNEEAGDHGQSDISCLTNKQEESDRESISPGRRQSISPSNDLCTAFNFSSASKTRPMPVTDKSVESTMNGHTVESSKSLKPVSKKLSFNKAPSQSDPPKDVTPLKSKVVAFTSSCLSTDILQPRRFSCEAPQMAVTVPPIKPVVKTVSLDNVRPTVSSSDKDLRKTSSLPLHRKECDIPAHWHTAVQIHSKDTADSSSSSGKTEIPVDKVLGSDENNKIPKETVSETVQSGEFGKSVNAYDDISRPMEFDFDQDASSSVESEEVITPGIEFDAEQLLESISEAYPVDSPLTGIDSESDNALPSAKKHLGKQKKCEIAEGKILIERENLPAIVSPAEKQDKMKKLTKVTEKIGRVKKVSCVPSSFKLVEEVCAEEDSVDNLSQDSRNPKDSVRVPLQSQTEPNKETHLIRSQILTSNMPATSISLTGSSSVINEIIRSHLKEESMEIEIDNSMLITRVVSLLLVCVDYDIFNPMRPNDVTLDDIPVAEQGFIREMIALHKTGVSDGKFIPNRLLPLLLKLLLNFGNLFPLVIDLHSSSAKGHDIASLTKSLTSVLSQEKKSKMFSLPRTLSLCRVFGFLCRASQSFSSLVDICRYGLIWQKFSLIVSLIQTLHCWTDGLKSHPLVGKSVLRILRKMATNKQIINSKSKGQIILDQVAWFYKTCGWSTAQEEESVADSSNAIKYSVDKNWTAALDECMSRLSCGKLSQTFEGYLKDTEGNNNFLGSVFDENTEEAIHCLELLPREYGVEYVVNEIINRRFWPLLNQWSQHIVIHGDVDEGRTVSNVCIAVLLEALTDIFSSYILRQKQMHKSQPPVPHLQSYFVTICNFLDNFSKHYQSRAPVLVQCAAASFLLRTCFCNPKNASTSLKLWLKATSNTSQSVNRKKHQNLNLLIQYSKCSEDEIKNICSYLDSKFSCPPEPSLHSLLWPT